ncbi:MAG: PEP-CTERM sorting domain-containing protein [Pseudomonadota bacterium]|nr:PEP-CTERM sorting domain-containing protein [Pseudomonadota bacterium]
MKLKTLLVACAMSVTLPAYAALTINVNDIPNSQVIDFENFDGFLTTGPETVAPGVSFTGTPGSVLGAFIADLGNNGLWGVGNHFAATDAIGTLHFTFVNGLTSAAGALLNSYDGNSMIIIAFGDNHQIIESHIIDVDAPEDRLNAGTFFGITHPTADIRSISFTGMGLVADNVTFTIPIPEPEIYVMMLAGLGLLGPMARRHRNSGVISAKR